MTVHNDEGSGDNIDIIRRDILIQTRNRMGHLFTSNQVLGRTQTIGCAAVEITQRCNLDCTLCYLSENSELVKDIPIEEIFRRLDDIRHQYGEGVHVQITGGDPALRKHNELIEIVKYARQIGLYPALFTNGIAASRKLLIQLAQAGLTDIAFHVDTTQKRADSETERELNQIRTEYIERARGLGLMVIFNCTVHQGNFFEIPALVSFFADNAEVVGFVSFQLQAETGRGEWGKRNIQITLQTVRAQIEYGAGRQFPWDVVRIGHPECHNYAATFVINSQIYPVVEDRQLFIDFLQDFSEAHENRHSKLPKLLVAYVLLLLKQPRWWLRSLHYLLSRLWSARYDLVRSRGKIHKLSFFVHNFMDAGNLDEERVNACSFMVMTAEGPVSMCAHNARRDEYILKPITITRRDGTIIDYQPLAQQKRKRNANDKELNQQAVL